MPKNIRNTKKRKRGKEKKSSNSKPRTDSPEPPPMPDPNEGSLMYQQLSDLTNTTQVKNEAFYPNTRFQHSTTLFPAEGIEEKYIPTETLCETFKCSKDGLISTMAKKRKENDSQETINSFFSDDCVIVENPKKRLKVEVIDLTDGCHPMDSILCTPVKTSFLENRLPCKLKRNLQFGEDIRVKGEQIEEITDISADTVGLMSMDYNRKRIKTGRNKVSEINSKDNTTETYGEVNKITHNTPPEDSSSGIQVKTERSMPTESVNADESSIEHPMRNLAEIKAEKGISSESNAEVNSENSLAVVSTDTNPTTDNILLRAEPNKENEGNSINVTIKVEQNENCLASKSSVDSPDSNSIPTCPAERPIKIEKNKNENYEASDNYTQVTAAEGRNYPEKMDFQDAYICEKNQNSEDMPIKMTNSNTVKITVVSSEMSNRNEFGISSILDGGTFSDGSQLHEKEMFRTPILKYLNCNTKVGVHEISHALCVILNLTEERNLGSNPDFSQLKTSINEKQIQSLSNSDDLGEEMLQDNSPNIVFESCSGRIGSNPGSDSDFHTTCNSPMDIGSPLEDENPAAIRLPSLNNSDPGKTSKNLLMQEMENHNEFNNLNSQIFNDAKSKKQADAISILDALANSDIMDDENLFHNLSQINFSEYNPVRNDKKHKFPADFPTQSFCNSRPIENPDAFEAPSKRVKISEKEAISQSGRVIKLGDGECDKYACIMANPHYAPDHPPNNHFGPDFLSKSSDSSLGASYSGQNVLTTPTNHQNDSHPICSGRSLQNPEHRHLVSTRPPKDHYSSMVQRSMKSQTLMSSFNISQICPMQSTPEAAKLLVHPLVNQITSDLTSSTVHNYSNAILPPAELFRPTTNTIENQQVKPPFPGVKNFQPLFLNQQSCEKQSHALPSPALEGTSVSMTQHDSNQSIQIVRDQQMFSNFPTSHSSSSNHHHLLMPHNIYPSVSRHNTLNDCDNTLIDKNQEATRNFTLPHESSSKFASPKISLIPKELREDVGKKMIQTDEVYLLIIERKIEWIIGIEGEIGVQRMTEICRFQKVQSTYENHLVYYNTFFPLLMIECFSKLSIILKEKKSEYTNICKVVECKTNQNYVRIDCETFIHHLDMERIPKIGHIILVKFATISKYNSKCLGFVCDSSSRYYKHDYDHSNKILKHIKVNDSTDLRKVKISFSIAFNIPDIKGKQIHISNLTSIKRFLWLNDALQKLQCSPFCNTILGPRNKNIRSFALPRRQDTTAMITTVEDIVQSLNLASQLVLVKSAPFTDSFLAIVQIVEEIRKGQNPGKILICVRSEMVCQMGLNLMETSSNLVIINRERENVHEKLHSRVLDVMISHVAKERSIPGDLAKSKVLQNAEVLLAETGVCFYKDIKNHIRDLAYCIIHDAHSFTEPESLLPLLYDIKHLILFGDPDESCILNSECGVSLGYNKSLFHRLFMNCVEFSMSIF